MKISAKSEYACIAMLELAMHADDTVPMPVKAIAEAHGISSRFLVQILLQLKKEGYVASERGTSGGYQLAVSPEAITLADIILAIDGESAFPTLLQSKSDDRSPAAQMIFNTMNDILLEEQTRLRQRFAEISLADLVRDMQCPTEPMYHI